MFVASKLEVGVRIMVVKAHVVMKLQVEHLGAEAEAVAVEEQMGMLDQQLE